MMSSSSRAHRSLSPSSPSLFSPEDYSGIVVETTPDTLAPTKTTVRRSFPLPGWVSSRPYLTSAV